MNARKVIIDCDPGIDDVLALLLALRSPELDVLGITVVCGNVPTAQGGENALKALEFLERLDIPVYLGETKPLVRTYVDAMDTHGADGLGETFLLRSSDVSSKEGAVEFMAKTLREEEGVSVIALGPLTNLARLIERYPDALSGLEELVTMGGSYRSHGNCSPVAEYNYWCDPDAAKMVFEAFSVQPALKGKHLNMIGLDVTRDIVLTPNLVEYMCCLSKETGDFIRNITRFYFDFHWKQEGVIGCVINDPLAVAYFVDRSLCGGFLAYTDVQTEGVAMGQTVVDTYDFWKKEKNSLILTETDPFRFMEFFISRVFDVSEDEVRRVLKQIMVKDAGKLVWQRRDTACTSWQRGGAAE
ncbi:nucleoside hydrolase [Anaerotignum lactatifermentans]|uniref:Nucleoside hydrolase n=1 Tax=Anaerotignum lactatifermentans TaxID=160404 RepID=A0ABS2G878_9FIRM|nr:nucleoside hydrolase [Anaerotignum lactatifermentans]MBM6828401.1 nucleoside hydrolase [Anaerotignum lactatifermentans]MBM6877681.1 nucleoside hydrolase [Anaerotignum lactatifermentans]MBM6949984.1 nucleoside hydrolase [Anaerotignum lactatifermentans]